jgi:WD40 repeat protein
VLHLLAHGLGSAVILCDAAGNRADAVSDELAGWCGASSRLELAFLQACWTAQTQGRGSLGGVAQRLLNPHGGNLAAVIASSYPLDAEGSTAAAGAFYDLLARQSVAELDLARNLPLPNWSWALLELWVRLSPLGVPQGRASIQYLSPYRGLGSFQERDARLFFGRDAEVAEGLQILEREPVVLLVGSAGSGKSSLLRAGLAHHVRTQGLAGRSDWRVALLRPGYSPLRSLQEALTPLAGPPPAPAAAADRLADLRVLLARVCAPDRPLLLLCDQFEELFTLCPDEAEHVVVAQALAELAQRQPADQPYFRLVLAMRSEFLGAAATLSAALPGTLSLPKRPWLLGPPDSRALQAIITRPAEHCGYEFEGPRPDDANSDHHQGLQKRIFQERLLNPRPIAGVQVGEPTSPLPLVEFALQQLWLEAVRRDRDTQLFTHADYDRLGGLSGAIGTHAEKVYQELMQTPKLGPNPRELVETLFQRLVGPAGTRRPQPRNDLVTGTNDPQAAHWVIDRLVEGRLLTIRPNPAAPDDRHRALVELTHDVLLESWDRLKRLITENPRDRELRERFENDFTNWQRGLPPELPPESWRLLPSYHTAVKYLSWLDVTRAHRLTAPQENFVKGLRRRVSRRRATWVLGLAGSLLLAAFMTVLAIWAWIEQLRVERHLYVTEMRVASEAWQAGDLDQVQDLLKKWQQRDGWRRLRGPEWDYLWRLTHRGWPAGSGPEHFLDHGKSLVKALAFAPDGRLVSGTEDGSLFVWDTKKGKEPARLQGPGEQVRGIRFSPDGHALVVWSWEYSEVIPRVGHLRLYDAGTWTALPPLPGLPDVITWASFDADGRLLVAGRRNNAAGEAVSSHVLVWQAAAWRSGGSGNELLQGKPSELTSVLFCPDGQTLVVGGWKEDTPGAGGPALLDVRDPATKQVKATLVGPDEQLDSPYVLNATANGQRLAAMGLGNGVLLWQWDRDHWQRLPHALPAVNSVYTLAFAPDGQTLATAGRERGVTVWDVALGQEHESLKGHTAEIFALAFSSDGRVLASGAGDGRVRLWDVAGGEEDHLHVADSDVRAVAFSPDGRELAIGTDQHAAGNPEGAHEGTVRLWDLASGVVSIPAGGPGKNLSGINALAYSRNGRFLAWAEQSGNITLWDRSQERVGASLSGHQGPVKSIAFSPNSALLASGGDDDTVRLWSVERQQEIPLPNAAAPPGGDGKGKTVRAVYAVVFSRDGNLLAAGGADETVRLWDPAGRAEPVRLDVSRGSLAALAFSPRAALLVCGGEDSQAPTEKEGQTINWWDVRTHKRLGIPSWHGGNVRALAFWPDGRRLVSASDPGTVRVWDTETHLEVLTLTNHEPVFTLAVSPDGHMLATGDGGGVVRLRRNP